MGRMVREGRPVDVVGLTKTFGALKAVDDLTFSVRPGVVTGFLGPNGSGKTTTLRCEVGRAHVWTLLPTGGVPPRGRLPLLRPPTWREPTGLFGTFCLADARSLLGWDAWCGREDPSTSSA